MSQLFKDLEQGFKEVLAYEKGQKKLRTRLIEIPEPPMEYQAEDVKRIRQELHYSQGIFAKFLNVSIKTVQAWEAGRRKPSHAALRLLEIIDKGGYRLQH